MAKLIVGVNDLSTWCKQNNREILLVEWNYDKNGDLNPCDLSFGSHTAVWWRCFLGHEWQSQIANRAKANAGCPYCANTKVLQGFNDLETRYPDVAAEWHPFKNGDLTPTDVLCGSLKVWWKCSEGHEWQTEIIHRTFRGDKCPYCSNKKVLQGFNDLQSKFPDIAKEWNYSKNQKLLPSDVVYGSKIRVWWKCSEGHEWQAVICDRVIRQTGCPYCKGKMVIKGKNDLQSLRPEIAKEWHPTKNGDLTPSDVMSRSNRSVWWKCIKGHEWKATVGNRVGLNQGCPFCSGIGTSLPEQAISFYLGQVCEVNQRYKVKGKEIDVYLPEYRIGIEYDGIYFHPTEELFKESEKDKQLSDNGINVIRVKEADINNVVDNVIYYKVDNLGSNYQWAVIELCKRLSELTDNIQFRTIDIDIQRDILKIREKLSLFYKDKSVASKFPDLEKEWNYEKNGELMPDMMSAGSNIKVWWKCTFGHEWQATPHSRSRGIGCPYCSNRKVVGGRNDLQTLFPDIAKQWHPSKNGELRPSDVVSKSNKKVWWRCSLGHEWEAAIDRRTVGGTSCPYCSNNKVLQGFNDLQTRFPELSTEWHPTKNGDLKPTDISPFTRRKVWWLGKCGHEWQTSVSNRTGKNSGCPYCSRKRKLSRNEL